MSIKSQEAKNIEDIYRNECADILRIMYLNKISLSTCDDLFEQCAVSLDIKECRDGLKLRLAASLRGMSIEQVESEELNYHEMAYGKGDVKEQYQLDQEQRVRVESGFSLEHMTARKELEDEFLELFPNSGRSDCAGHLYNGLYRMVVDQIPF